MDHFIYKTTCLITGKYYLGMHSGELSDTYLGSGIVLKASVKKYGASNHVRTILLTCETREQLSLKEAELITEQIISDPLCMNLVPGGLGGTGKKHSDEARAKQRAVAAARPKSHYVTGERHGMFGKTHTPEVRERIRIAQSKPKGPFSEVHRARLSEAAKARHARARTQA